MPREEAAVTKEILLPPGADLESLCAAWLLARRYRARVVIRPLSGAPIPAVCLQDAFGRRCFGAIEEVLEIADGPDAVLKLADYCRRADRLDLSRQEAAPGSLKFTIRRLRAVATDGYQVWRAFRVLADAIAGGEEGLLYRGGPEYLTRTLPEFRGLFSAPIRRLKDLPIKLLSLDGLVVAINESDFNVANEVFDRYPEVDVLIFRSPTHGWAGFIKRSQEREVPISFEPLLALLRRAEPEAGWFLHASGNVLICGGPKAPQHSSGLPPEALLEFLREVNKTRRGKE